MKRFVSVLAFAWTVALAAPVASPVLAQDGQEQEDPAESRATEFRAVTGPQAEQVPGGPLLVGAYAIVWLLLLGFVVRLARLHAQTARDVERLEKSVAAGGGGKGA